MMIHSMIDGCKIAILEEWRLVAHGFPLSSGPLLLSTLTHQSSFGVSFVLNCSSCIFRNHLSWSISRLWYSITVACYQTPNCRKSEKFLSQLQQADRHFLRLKTLPALPVLCTKFLNLALQMFPFRSVLLTFLLSRRSERQSFKSRSSLTSERT